MWFGTSGGLFRYDGKTFVNFTTKNGLASDTVRAIHRDPDGVMWFGTQGGLSRYDGKKFVNFTTKDGLAHNVVSAIHRDSDGAIWFGTWGGVSRYDGKTFVNFTTADGLAGNGVYAIHRDPDGVMWFGTGVGVSRYDGKKFVNFTTADGLAHNVVSAIHRDPDGVMWFGTYGGVSRYDGKDFVNFTTKDGLAANGVGEIYRDPDGVMWFGTVTGGVSRYDGSRFVTLTTRDGLVDNQIRGLHGTPDGVIWIGTNGGISRYDGTRFVNLTDKDGLAHIQVEALHCAPDGAVWVGMFGSLSRYDGTEFVNFTTQDGLANDIVRAVHSGSDGAIWIGTEGGGSRYNGKDFVNFTQKDGLAGNAVYAIHRDPDGVMWFGTGDVGVSIYDGVAWASLDGRDGLAGNRVGAIHQDADGSLWFGTTEGVTRYRPSQTSPKVHIVSVTTDQTYRDLAAIPTLTTGARVTFAYNAIDFKTLPEKRQYRIAIVEGVAEGTSLKKDAEYWRSPTKADTFDYTFKKPGIYTFAVGAIDRDLNYSEPATIVLKVVPPWYLNGWIAIPSGGAILALLISSIVFGSHAYSKRREAQRLEREGQQLRDQMLEQEREAHEQEAQARKEIEAKAGELAESNRQLEVAKDAAEAANRAKSTFLANMSHEIRTPMNAVLGYAQILLRGDSLQPDDRNAVETIEKSGDHLLKLINDVLDLSKIEAGRMELQETDFDLNATIDMLSTMFQTRCEQKRLDWRVEWDFERGGVGARERGSEETDDTPPRLHTSTPARLLVHGDEGKLRQVLINLLGNAVKFTDEGGVTLRITPTLDARQSEREVRMEEDFTFHASRFTFEVIDTGVGIPPEAQAAILEPFQQGEAGATKGGTGLGLTISKRHIELMDGELALESPPSIPLPPKVGEQGGRGSRFFFTIPLPPAASLAVAEPSQWADVTRLGAGYQVKALIADDTKVNRDVLSRILSDLGVEAIESENGQQGLEMIREHLPHIAFMDIRMPVMDGLEAAERIMAEFGGDRLKLVAISASALAHEQQMYLDAGFDSFISKPFRVDDICESLGTLLGVEFERGEPAGAAPAPEEVLDVSLPEELLEQLKTAAELYMVTALERHLKAVEALGEGEERLAAQLRDLIRNYDMNAVLRILSEIRQR